MTAHPVSPARAADRHSPSLTVGLDLVSGRLTVTGPLSRDTIHRFRDAIVTLLVCDCPWWTVDVTELTACDRAGEHALVAACRWAARQGRRVALVGTPPWLQRKLNRFGPGHRRVHNGPVTLADADPVTTGADLKSNPAPSRGDPGASDDRDQPAEMSPQVPLFTATVNGKKGTIGIRGHLDRVGAELLCGSVVALQRLGRQHIGIRQAPGATVDAEARVVLAALARRLSAEGVQLEIP